jgi:hypothetical protein
MLASALAHGQSTRLPWTSSFDDGTFNAWDGVRSATGLAITSSGCRIGRCASAPLVPGGNSDNYGDFHFGDHVTTRGAKVEEVWLSMYSKFDGNFTWPDRSQKLAILNLTDGTSQTRLYQVYLYVRPNGEYAVDRSNLQTWQFFGLFQNVGGTPAAVRWGQWDKLKLHVRLNTPGQADGVVRLWINGQLRLEYRNVDVRQGTMHGMNKLNLSSYATRQTSTPGTQWWDDFTLSTTDPDSGSNPPPPASPPNPPVNFRIVPNN